MKGVARDNGVPCRHAMHAIQARETEREPESADAVAGLVRQLAGGRKTTVLVVDDSPL